MRHRLLLSLAFFVSAACGGDDDPAIPDPCNPLGGQGCLLPWPSMAYVTADAGIPVRLKDKDDAALGRGFKQIAGILDERVKRRRLP